MGQTIHLVSQAKEYYTWECDWNSHLLRDFDLVHHYDPERQYVGPNTILVVGSSGPNQHEEQTRAWFARFRAAGLKVGLIHLSDEWKEAPVDFYEQAAFVFRNCYRGAVQRPGHCWFFGLGWKGGFREVLVDRPIDQRSLTWSFAGMIKTTRGIMIKAAQRIPGGRHITTTGFGGQGGGIATPEYARMMNDTVFALCPRGNTAVDCFRVYEAFEAGAIPIVEDDGGSDLAGELIWPWNFMRVEAWRRSYWRYHFRNPFRPSFWKMAYGEDFPAPRIMHWETVDTLIRSIDVAATAARCRAWWATYKSETRALMAQVVRDAFFDEKEG
jgi:hypothetical protein